MSDQPKHTPGPGLSEKQYLDYLYNTYLPLYEKYWERHVNNVFTGWFFKLTMRNPREELEFMLHSYAGLGLIGSDKDPTPGIAGTLKVFNKTLILGGLIAGGIYLFYFLRK